MAAKEGGRHIVNVIAWECQVWLTQEHVLAVAKQCRAGRSTEELLLVAE